MSKKAQEKIEKGNVIKLLLICIAVIILVLLLRRWYLKNQELERQIPVLSGVITHQINPNELFNYINDADTAVVYMCASDEDVCRNLEKEMKTFITKNSLEDTIIYLDVKEVDNISEFYKELNSTYDHSTKIGDYPTFMYFQDAALKEVLTGKRMNVQKIEDFLKEIEILS